MARSRGQFHAEGTGVVLDLLQGLAPLAHDHVDALVRDGDRAGVGVRWTQSGVQAVVHYEVLVLELGHHSELFLSGA